MWIWVFGIWYWSKMILIGYWLGSQKAGMLRECRTFEHPSFPASQLQTFETNNFFLIFNSIGVKRIRGWI
jgi:hypothetical protein